jgi:UPF0755 protein
MPAVYPEMFAVSGKKIEVTITAGMSAREAADAIMEAGVAESGNDLAKWMEKYGIDRSIMPGAYDLIPGNAMYVARQLKDAKPRTYRFTLIPGSRYKDIPAELYAQVSDYKIDKAEQEKLFESELADDSNYPKEIRFMLPAKPKDRIIFLLPDTYFLAPGIDIGKQFISRSSKLWFHQIGRHLPVKVNKKYILERGTIASLVEGEAKISVERPLLAGIFLNRIEKNMRLQSCATVIYCWEERGEKKNHLTYKDLEIDSPYNTYLNKGLPPGPISVPSEDSWKSALDPEKSDYLFFFATGKGNHIFSRTYEEHIKKQSEATR